MKTIVMQAPLYSLSGYGAHSRDMLMALWESQKFNILTLPTGWGGTSTSYSIPAYQLDILNFTVNNKIHQGVDFIWLQVGIPNEFKRQGKINIGVTAGIEATKLPPGWAEGCNQMDYIIVPSTFVAQLFRENGVTVPIEVIEEGVDVEVFNNLDAEEVPNISTFLDNLPTSFNFLGGGQWLGGSVGEDRKGIGILVKTFLETFKDNKEVGLILKTFIQNNSSMDFFYLKERLQEITQGQEYPRVYLLSGDLSESELRQLYQHPNTKAYVSMTSGEGWHRMPLEVMACNKPVLATGWSGHMDYFPSSIFTKIDYTLGNVPLSAIRSSGGLFTKEMQWAFPDIPDARRKLRKIYEEYPKALELAKIEGERVRKDYSSVVCYNKLVALFDGIELEKKSNLIKLPGMQ